MAWYDKYTQTPSAGPRDSLSPQVEPNSATVPMIPSTTPREMSPIDPSQARTAQPAGLPPIDQAIQQWQAQNPYTPEAREQLYQWLQSQGYSVSRPTHAGGTQISDDKIVDNASTRVLDLSTDTGWMLGQDDYWVDGKGSATPHVYTPWASDGGGGGDYGAFGSGRFSMPTLADLRGSPGYQFARDEGLKAIERSAAAKGTLLTGGTLKALAGYGTGLADQTYGQHFDRARQTHQTNYDDLYNIARLGYPQ